MINTNDSFYKENILAVNKLMTKVILTTILVPVLFIILTIIGIWQVPHSYSIIIICYSILAALISHILNIDPKHSILSMYWGIFACSMFIELLAIKNVITVNITYAIVPFMSTLYYNKKLTIWSTTINFILMILTFFIRMDGIIQNVYVRNATLWTDTDWLISSISGYGVEYLFIFIVAFMLAKITRKSLDTMFETSAKLDDVNEKLMNQNFELQETQSRIIQFIADILGSHDLFTGRHVIHTQAYVKMISLELRKEGYYTNVLTDRTINDYKTAAFLHDIGKIHIPEGILNKPGKFTDQEFELMKDHPAEGLKLLEVLPAIDGGRFNEIAKQMAYNHHEKWDGTGYPRGIKGDEIPLCARIMASADVLDALISKRLYKEPLSIDEAIQLFKESKGSHFEECIADAVINCRDQIIQISEQFKRDEAESEAKEEAWWQNYHASLKKD